MKILKFDKLVRDKIPEHIRKMGNVPKTYVADEAEYYRRLSEKLLEEVNEFRSDDSLEELADVLEVMYALAEAKGASRDDLEKVREAKYAKRGGFTKRIVLVEAEDHTESGPYE